jgi:hypothetical protein
MNSTTITDLLSKIDALEGTKIELIAERDELSFAALVERDKKSAARIAEINSKLEGMHSEAATLKAALAEAQRRAATASAAEAVDAERKRAAKAEPILKRMAARGAKLDAAIRAYREEFAAIDDDLDELTRLGVPVPTRPLVKTNLRRANDAATSGLDLKTVVVPPNQRHSFDSLLKGWARPGLTWIATKLNNAAARAA